MRHWESMIAAQGDAGHARTNGRRPQGLCAQGPFSRPLFRSNENRVASLWFPKAIDPEGLLKG